MKRMYGNLVLVSAALAAGTLIYHFGLTDEAKTKARASVKSVSMAWEKVAQAAGLGSETSSKAEIRANQASTAAQWEALGY